MIVGLVVTFVMIIYARYVYFLGIIVTFNLSNESPLNIYLAHVFYVLNVCETNSYL
jgi:hypothetical protein